MTHALVDRASVPYWAASQVLGAIRGRGEIPAVMVWGPVTLNQCYGDPASLFAVRFNGSMFAAYAVRRPK